MKPVPICISDYIGDLGSGLITIHIAAEHALVFRTAGEHFLAQMLSFERSGLSTLDIALKRGFERCGGQMANRRMPLHLSEAAGNLVRRRFGICRARYGDHDDCGGKGSHRHSLMRPTGRSISARLILTSPAALESGMDSELTTTTEMASHAASARVW
jgi:hypothetical protein